MPPVITAEELHYVRVEPGIYLQNDAVTFCGHFGTMAVKIVGPVVGLDNSHITEIPCKEYGAILLLRTQRLARLPDPEILAKTIFDALPGMCWLVANAKTRVAWIAAMNVVLALIRENQGRSTNKPRINGKRLS